MDDGDFENLPRSGYSDKVLRDKAFNITKNAKFDGYQTGLAFMVDKYFEKKRHRTLILFLAEEMKLPNL